MTRVLFLVESFHPILGGGEQHIRLLSRGLTGRGMPCTVLTRRVEAAWPREEALDGVRVLRVPPSGGGVGGKYLMVPGVVASLARERATYDVIVVRGGRILALPALLCGRWLRKRVVLQSEVTGEISGEIYTWGTRLDRPAVRGFVKTALGARNALLADADAFVAISTPIREEFLAAGIPADRVMHIPHGVDTERFRPVQAHERQALRQRLGLPAQGALIVFTGRLLRGKGIEVLIEAFAGVAPQQPDARLLLVGSGAGQALSIEAELRRRVEQEGLAERVIFTGRVENVEDFLRASDVFAFPSFFEAMPLSVIEAAACGLPCVASRVGGIVDVIEDGRSGVLLQPGDVEAWSGALRALLSDPGRRAALGADARAVARARFDLSDNVDRYLALFSELADGAGA